jgi:hypothetical protein
MVRWVEHTLAIAIDTVVLGVVVVAIPVMNQQEVVDTPVAAEVVQKIMVLSMVLVVLEEEGHRIIPAAIL